ncbi:hypothetical protein ABT354_31740 [Streptomyces sp. NPDC000594]|uniref:SCO7613 C-terminal domain-containing membrane protein n=1 Tax=Streptomyces sp. NPDC000594 TaxID=3154261 RepID=UPI00332A4F33
MKPGVTRETLAGELAAVDRELFRLDAHRGRLLTRRAWLVAALQAPAAHPGAPAPSSPGAPVSPEASAARTQNTLLALGGLLLVVAAVAFTLVGWGHLGIGGRAAVLGGATAAALGAPLVLLRRGLVSTAESLGALGLALTALDAYALHRVALSGVDGTGYAAGAAAVLAGVWAGYGRVVPALRIPLPSAVVAAQLPLPLAAVSGAPGWALEWALLVTAAGTAVVALRAGRAAVRRTAVVGAALTGGGALLLAGSATLPVASLAQTAGPAALLTVAAGVALAVAARTAHAVAARVLASMAALSLIAGAGAVIRTGLPDGWAGPAYLLCATAVAAALYSPVRGRLSAPVRAGLAGAAGGVHAVVLLTAVPTLFLALTGPLSLLDGVWTAPAPDARAALASASPGATPAAACAVLLLCALALTALTRVLPSPATTGATDSAESTASTASTESGSVPAGAPAGQLSAAVRRADSEVATAGAVGLGWAAAFLGPAAVGLGYGATLAVQALVTVVALAVAGLPVRDGRWPSAAGAVAVGGALAGAVSTALLSLATRTATFSVLGLLLAALVAAAVVSRAGRAVRSAVVCGAVAAATALLLAVARAADLTDGATGLLLVVVPALVALVAGALRGHPVTVPLEASGIAVGALAALAASPELPMFALVCAAGGVIAAATAVREDRRRLAAGASAALFLLATWARLAAWEITTPEAFTLPLAIPALVVGAVRRRRAPETDSWAAYGPGLALGLGPSLPALLGDGHWLRPLLLGLAALVVTLLGAHHRLRAPLTAGGAVLALVTAHELAPYAVQVVDALPRWAPPALAGALLLAVGATYEQRLREVRRARRALGRLH